MKRPLQIKDQNGTVHRVVSDDPVKAMQQVANKTGVPVVAWRESRAPEDSIKIGMGRD